MDYTTEAKRFLQTQYSHNGDATLIYWCYQWWEWRDGRWVVMDSGPMRIQKEVLEWYERSGKELTPNQHASLYKRLEVVAFINLPDMPCWIGENRGEVLAFRDRLLDLEAWCRGERAYMQATPKWFSSKCCDFDFDPEAQCPVWHKTLEEWFPDDEDSVAMLQEWMGYLLTDDTAAEKFMLLWGPPRTGKGATIKVINAILGEATSGGTSLKALGAEFKGHFLGKTHLALPDMRLTKGSDKEAAIEFVTNVVGRDPVDVNRKHKDAVHKSHLPIRFTMACNNLPDFRDSTGALMERVLILRYKISFAGRTDPDLKRKLMGELPGITVWALEGLRRLRKGKLEFTVGATTQNAMMEFHDRMNPVEWFVGECLEVGAEHSEPKDLVYGVYKTKAQEGGKMPLSKEKFFEALYNARPSFVGETRPRDKDGSRERRVTGIRLRGGVRQGD